MSTGEITEDLKSARVVPCYGKNSKLDVSNSILNTISKLFERIIYQQLDKYLEAHKLCMTTNLILDPVIIIFHCYCLISVC